MAVTISSKGIVCSVYLNIHFLFFWGNSQTCLTIYINLMEYIIRDQYYVY